MSLKRLSSVLLIFVIIGYASACAKHVTPETPKAGAAIIADGIVIRVSELQAAVIQYCGPGPECAPNTISTPVFRDIIRAMIDIRTVSLAVPNGWQASVRAAWSQSKPRLAGIANPAIQAAFAAVDALIGAL